MLSAVKQLSKKPAKTTLNYRRLIGGYVAHYETGSKV